MKHTTLFALLVLPFFGWTQPERHGSNMERHETARIAFITNELSLSTEEAQQFWPVYNEMRSKIKEVMRKRHDDMLLLRNNEDLSAEQKEQILLNHYKGEQEVAAIRLQYHSKIKAVIGLEKTVQLFESERKFQREMMQRYKKKGERQGGKGSKR